MFATTMAWTGFEEHIDFQGMFKSFCVADKWCALVFVLRTTYTHRIPDHNNPIAPKYMNI
jgi:hypothetical protein